MKKLVVVLLVLVAMGGTTEISAQWARTLGNIAERAAKRAVERNVDRVAEKAVDKAFNTAENAAENAVAGNNRKNRKEKNEKNRNVEEVAVDNNAEEAPVDGTTVVKAGNSEQESEDVQPLEMAYAKSDFVRGDEIIFDDDVTREQLGEFPSQWDLIDGSIEVASLNGENVIYLVTPKANATIVPLFDKMKNYLPEKFTVEFDFWIGTYEQKAFNNNDPDEPRNYYRVNFYKADGSQRLQRVDVCGWYYDAERFNQSVSWEFRSPSGDDRNGEDRNVRLVQNGWNHMAISFNKRAMKIYVNGTRYANIPNTVAPGHLDFHFDYSGGYYENNTSIRNIRIAQGAVPLYDRMMSDGKFITYGITFDVGKATIKPESMGEINRIVKLMAENPELKFSVEGHTDSTGNAASNQSLSETRSQAIVDKLIELGIAKDRLKAVGKGQNSPIADNSTDEGRAKNRRVEFVKQ